MVAFLKFANLLWVYVLCGVLLAGFGYQVSTGEDPCALCFLERLEMIGIAVCIMLNMRFGIRIEHYGLAILATVGGRLISLRQIALHICPQFPTFGTPVWGFDLYTWAYIVFNCSVFAAAVLLLIQGLSKQESIPPFWNLGAKIAFWLLVAIAGANGIWMLKICGLSACG